MEKSIQRRDEELRKFVVAKMQIEKYLRSEGFLALIMKAQEKAIRDVMLKRNLRSYPPVKRAGDE